MLEIKGDPMKTVIYYFTGTGNSLEIARQLSEKLPGAHLRSLASAYRAGKLELDAEVVGFVFPVYFFGIPVALRSLLENAQWQSVQYTFAAANYGSMPGGALYQTAGLIEKNGGRLDAGYLVQMPDNYLPMFPAPGEKVQARNFEGLRKRIPRLAAEILERKPSGIEKSKLRIDRFIAPLVYPTVYKFKEMDTNYWLTEACNGCTLCARTCPFDNIQMADQKPQWQHRCEMCMRCIHICPQKAIQYKQSTLKKGRYIHPNVTVKDLTVDGSLTLGDV